MAEQLAFDLPAPARTFHLVTVCLWCGEPLASVPIEDPGDRWEPAALWGYVAQQGHNREQHPDRV